MKIQKTLKTLNEDEEFFKGYRTDILKSVKHNEDANRNSVIPQRIIDSIVEQTSKKQISKRLSEQIKPLATKCRIAQTPLQSRMQPLSQPQQKQLSKFFEVKRTGNLNKVEEVIGFAAAKIANDVNANCIVSIEKAESERFEEEPFDTNLILVKIVIFKKISGGYNKEEYNTKMKNDCSGSMIPIKELLIEAIHKRYIQKGERIVCVSNESVGMGYKGLIFIFDVDKIFFNISTHNLTQTVRTDVLEAAINLSLEIGGEGREGRKIGTAFIIGKREEISRYARQLVINPFSNYPEESRLINDPNLRETIKGFSQLDGVFMIDEKGIILSAGTLISLNIDDVELPGLSGFGTRHKYSAAITKLTDAIAVVVSESGGIVRVFKDGRLIMKLP